MTNKYLIQNIAILSIMISISMLLSYLETLFPLPIAIPGFKLGLANIVVLVLLYFVGFKQAFLVNILRVVLIALTFGSPFTFLYSLTGALVSTTLMSLLRDKVGVIIVSIIGALAHNFSQLILAQLILNTNLSVYIPFLFAISIFMGYFNSVILNQIIRKLNF